MKVYLVLVLALFAFVVPAFSQGYGCNDGNVPDADRIDCFGEQGSSEEGCRARNCTWCSPESGDNFYPSCFYNMQAGGYLMVGEPIELPSGYRVNLQRTVGRGRFESEAETLTLEAEYQSNSRLRIKITDGSPRYEVPLTINPPSEDNRNPLYSIQFANDPLFSFSVVRKSSGAVLLSAGGSSGKFVFAEQYITLSWKPATENVYGIGENEQKRFKHDFSTKIAWPVYALGHNTDYTTNLYGVQPYYTVLENDGNAHSVVLVNSNAQEWSMLLGPLIQYTTIGGLLDFYIFLGPTPENTVQQYTEAVGRAPIPPYWSLGFHLCRYGYDTIESMKAAVDRTAQYNIPHDVQYGDIDIMDRELDFTYDPVRFAGLPEYIKELKAKGIKFMTILDPCISIGEPEGSYEAFELGEEMDVWYKRADGSNAVGRMWPDAPVYFPDYSNSRTKEWWVILVKKFHDLLEYDGLWIDMNEPANFVTGDVDGCTVNKLNNPPFMPKIRHRSLSTSTLCPDHKDSVGNHYDTHSLYGWFQSDATLAATAAGTQKRTLVLSRSTFLGSGKWASHWLGDNYSTWDDLYYSIIGMLQFNQFGIPMVGADICGHNYDAPAQLCQRWMQLGAFYPFSRNHNGNGLREQDPGSFGPEVAESSRKALEIRYTLLPYLYTLFYKHYVNGNTVARALWHEFPTDVNTVEIDRQFMWGTGLMISPVLEENATEVRAYFPDARLYSYNNGAEVLTRGGYASVDSPLDFIPLHVRGGNILPTQAPAVNTELSRNNPMGLIVALDDFNSAYGSLYYDDGDSFDPVEAGAYFYGIYATAGRRLTSAVVQDGYEGMASKTIESIRLMGAGPVTNVTVNGGTHVDFSSSPDGEVIIQNLRLQANSAFTITY